MIPTARQRRRSRSSDHVSIEKSARDAFGRRDWATAYAAYVQCGDLGPDDLDAFGEAAHWVGHQDETVDAYIKAHHLHLAAGSTGKAALSAFMLAVYLRVQGEGSKADGWLARSERLLAGEEEGREHGYPLYLRVAGLLGSDLDAARVQARRMQDLGRRFGDPNLIALGIYFEGRALVKQARVREGLALLDEAMLAAVSDGLSPFWTGAIYCGLISACHELVDHGRAVEWTETTRRWCEPLPVASLYPGICRVHWAEILDVRGAWEEAETEALGVCFDMERIDVFVVADGMYALGELRRRRGDFEGAQEAYERAHTIGRDPQPGLALLRLAQGRNEVASVSIASAIAGFGGSTLERAPLLAAQCEIALVAGDLDLADEAATEVTRIAEMFASVGLEAVGARCRGAVALARGDSAAALAALRMAAGHWLQVDAPYEVARTRVLLARASHALGDEDAAMRECSAARACFEQLGATNDLAALEEASGEPRCGLTAREVEVLQRVAAGASNREVAAELFISEKTVARHVSNIYVKLDVTSRAAATAAAYKIGLL